MPKKTKSKHKKKSKKWQPAQKYQNPATHQQVVTIRFPNNKIYKIGLRDLNKAWRKMLNELHQ